LLSKVFLIKQGQCCGLECSLCPYIPKYSGLTNKLCPKVLKNLEEWEKSELEVEQIKIEIV